MDASGHRNNKQGRNGPNESFQGRGNNSRANNQSNYRKKWKNTQIRTDGAGHAGRIPGYGSHGLGNGQQPNFPAPPTMPYSAPVWASSHPGPPLQQTNNPQQEYDQIQMSCNSIQEKLNEYYRIAEHWSENSSYEQQYHSQHQKKMHGPQTCPDSSHPHLDQQGIDPNAQGSGPLQPPFYRNPEQDSYYTQSQQGANWQGTYTDGYGNYSHNQQDMYAPHRDVSDYSQSDPDLHNASTQSQQAEDSQTLSSMLKLSKDIENYVNLETQAVVVPRRDNRIAPPFVRILCPAVIDKLRAYFPSTFKIRARMRLPNSNFFVNHCYECTITDGDVDAYYQPSADTSSVPIEYLFDTMNPQTTFAVEDVLRKTVGTPIMTTWERRLTLSEKEVTCLVDKKDSAVQTEAEELPGTSFKTVETEEGPVDQMQKVVQLLSTVVELLSTTNTEMASTASEIISLLMNSLRREQKTPESSNSNNRNLDLNDIPTSTVLVEELSGLPTVPVEAVPVPVIQPASCDHEAIVPAFGQSGSQLSLTETEMKNDNSSVRNLASNAIPAPTVIVKELCVSQTVSAQTVSVPVIQPVSRATTKDYEENFPALGEAESQLLTKAEMRKRQEESNKQGHLTRKLTSSNGSIEFSQKAKTMCDSSAATNSRRVSMPKPVHQPSSTTRSELVKNGGKMKQACTTTKPTTETKRAFGKNSTSRNGRITIQTIQQPASKNQNVAKSMKKPNLDVETKPKIAIDFSEATSKPLPSTLEESSSVRGVVHKIAVETGAATTDEGAVGMDAVQRDLIFATLAEKSESPAVEAKEQKAAKEEVAREEEGHPSVKSQKSAMRKQWMNDIFGSRKREREERRMARQLVEKGFVEFSNLFDEECDVTGTRITSTYCKKEVNAEEKKKRMKKFKDEREFKYSMVEYDYSEELRKHPGWVEDSSRKIKNFKCVESRKIGRCITNNVTWLGIYTSLMSGRRNMVLALNIASEVSYHVPIGSEIFKKLENWPYTSRDSDVAKEEEHRKKCEEFLESKILFYENEKQGSKENKMHWFFKVIKDFLSNRFIHYNVFLQDITVVREMEKTTGVNRDMEYYANVASLTANSLETGSSYNWPTKNLIREKIETSVEDCYLKHFVQYITKQCEAREDPEEYDVLDKMGPFEKILFKCYRYPKGILTNCTPREGQETLEEIADHLQEHENTLEMSKFFDFLCQIQSSIITVDIFNFTQKCVAFDRENKKHLLFLLKAWFGYQDESEPITILDYDSFVDSEDVPDFEIC